MTLHEIASALEVNQTREAFDRWITENENDLSNFFYGLNGKDLYNLGFDIFFYKNVSTSNVYKDYHSDKAISAPFDFFLNLISVAAEKLSEIGISSLAEILIIDLPESASKYRLKALQEFVLVEDIKTSYSQKLPAVLELLELSQILFEEGNSRQAIDVLIFFYGKAIRALESRGYNKEILDLQGLFKDEDLTKRYPFLSHQIITDLIEGKDPFLLYPIDITQDCLTPSFCIKELFSTLNRNYYSHPRVDNATNRLWGYSVERILNDVLVRGRGDFGNSYGEITADEKVMLYCYFNLKKHFFTSYAIFESVVESLQDFFSNEEYKPVFFDLGCGPMTSGLALGDLIHSNTGRGINFSYIGIDIADAMLRKAESFQELDIFSEESSFIFSKNWNDIDPSTLHKFAGKNDPIIFNASYLFASSSLDAADLAAYVSNVAKNFTNTYFVFQNPDSEDRNVKYEEFKKLIDYKSILKGSQNIRYKSASRESNENVSYEILKLIL